jgi:hypothetical protein
LAWARSPKRSTSSSGRAPCPAFAQIGRAKLRAIAGDPRRSGRIREPACTSGGRPGSASWSPWWSWSRRSRTPSYADNYLLLSHLLIYAGEAEEGVEIAIQGMPLDPDSMYHTLMHFADGQPLLSCGMMLPRSSTLETR